MTSINYKTTNSCRTQLGNKQESSRRILDAQINTTTSTGFDKFGFLPMKIHLNMSHRRRTQIQGTYTAIPEADEYDIDVRQIFVDRGNPTTGDTMTLHATISRKRG
jgi:hypothetical protein